MTRNKRIRLSLSETLYNQVVSCSKTLGLRPGEYLRLLVVKELDKLTSMKNGKQQKVGRPAVSLKAKDARTLGQSLLDVYSGLKVNSVWGGFPEAFEDRFNDQIAQVRSLLAAENLEGLKDFEKERPWLTRSK